MTAVAEVTSCRPTRSATRTIRIGILGLGQVGQAVARLVPGNSRLKESGVRLQLTGALVRDVHRVRRCPAPPRLTAEPAAFLAGEYDVVVEAIGSIEPARAIVSTLLTRGIPVVTANKALVAMCGDELSRLAARHGTTLRYEASALAGVPFLGALASRPLVSDVQQFVAIVNGTSNFILSRLDAESTTFAAALADAQSLGLTEPDPSRDLDGLDAADKLSLLASVFGWGNVPTAALDVQSIDSLSAEDLVVARTFDATIKPVAWARRSDTGISAFVGPALVRSRHPLAALDNTLCGIQLSGRYVSDLFFSGPGAGPDVTAATIVDDVVEAVSSAPQQNARMPRNSSTLNVNAPDTEWLVHARFPGVVPDASAALHIFRSHSLDVAATSVPSGDALWVRVRNASRRHIEASLAAMTRTHRLRCRAIRSLLS